MTGEHGFVGQEHYDMLIHVNVVSNEEQCKIRHQSAAPNTSVHNKLR